MIAILLMLMFQATFPKQPPIDVAPIEKHVDAGMKSCGGSIDPGGCTSYVPAHIEYSCVDKTRFLMTSEDGKKHCMKLN